MKCESCGAEIPDGSFECDNCGWQAPVDNKKKKQSIGWGCQLVCWLFVAGILIAIAAPNFIRSHKEPKYFMCLDAVSGVKIAQEMYFTDHDTYTTEINRLGVMMIAGCTDPTGSSPACNGRVYTRIKNNCGRNSNWVITAGEYNDLSKYYQIKATTGDRYKCKICVTPDSYLPSSFRDCPGWKMKCPPPPDKEEGPGKPVNEHSEE